MCNPASFVVTQNNIFFNPPEFGESHYIIMKRHNILNNLRKIRGVAVEITPPNFDFTLPFDKWIFEVDFPKDFLPDWWNAKEAEIACREKLPEWFETHCIKRNIVVHHGFYLVTEGSPWVIMRGGRCFVCGNSSPNIFMFNNAECNNLNLSKANINMAEGACKCHTYDNSSPNIKMQGNDGICHTYDNSSPNIIIRTNALCITHHQSSPNIEIRNGGQCDIYGISKPNINMKYGCLNICNHSQPNIIMYDGIADSCEDSRPNILFYDGLCRSVGNSKPNIKKGNIIKRIFNITYNIINDF